VTKRAFWFCVLVGVLLVVSVVPGGAAGGLKKNHHQSHRQAQHNSHLSGSNLAALNWTDESSHERHTIFYQLDGALFVSQPGASYGRAQAASASGSKGGIFIEVATAASPSSKSQLAAATGYCCGKGCINAMCVTFQEQDNSAQCSYCPTAKLATLSTAFSNSPLILVPLAADNGNSIRYDNELLMLLLDNSNISCLVYKCAGDEPSP
jgi:hypothetical protein